MDTVDTIAAAVERAAQQAAVERARRAAAVRATVERGCPAAVQGCLPRDYMTSGRARTR